VKLDYLDALKRAMTGLPPATQAKTLAWYEQRFVDGIAAGRSEMSIAQELGEPRKVALTLRASAHMDALSERNSPASALRMLVAGAGLLVFNLFMAIPAAVVAGLLVAVYASALAFYVAGIAITASALAGANELVLNNPLYRHEVTESGAQRAAREPVRTRVWIGEHGIEVQEVTAPESAQTNARADSDSGTGAGAGAGAGRTSIVVRSAGKMAEPGVRITTGLDRESRSTQILLGLGMVFGAIVLFLLALVATRYTCIGLTRYLRMNMSLLKGG
jgi:uncharacterized membrane protein